MDCTQWWGPHFHWFWIFPLTFVILMVIFAAFMIRRLSNWRGGDGHHQGGLPLGWCEPGQGTMGRWSETPHQILNRRYASGEISRDEYLRRKSSLPKRPPGQ
jgi:putative membrane protein